MNRLKLLVVLLTIAVPFAFAQPEAVSDYSRYLDSFVDRSVDPGQDFFRYAVGNMAQEQPHSFQRKILGNR